MKLISTLQTSRLASPAAFLLHSLRGWRLLWTVARHLATEQLSSHLPWPQPQSLVWHRVIKMNMPSCSSKRNLPRKMKLENTDPDGYCLAGNPPNLNTCPRNPSKPQPRVFLVSAGLATRPSHWQLASQPGEHRAVRYPKGPGLTFQRFWRCFISPSVELQFVGLGCGTLYLWATCGPRETFLIAARLTAQPTKFTNEVPWTPIIRDESKVVTKSKAPKHRVSEASSLG